MQGAAKSQAPQLLPTALRPPCASNNQASPKQQSSSFLETTRQHPSHIRQASEAQFSPEWEGLRGQQKGRLGSILSSPGMGVSCPSGGVPHLQTNYNRHSFQLNF